MKKILLLILIFIIGLFIGTKLFNTKEDKSVNKNSCSSKLLDVVTNGTKIDNIELSKILQSCGSIICDPKNVNLSKKIEGFHTINNSNYENMIYRFWGSNIDLTNSKYYNEVKWSDIETEIKDICYEKYISFYYSANLINDVSLTTTKSFTEKPSCYSIPLFKSIYENHKSDINANTKVKFYKALNQNNDVVVVFKIEGLKVGGYYDISDMPMIVIPGYLKFLKDLAKLLS
ncbi:hypothetical protein [Flavobacterium sp.]|uniref:hypothetical protein n=1 Tax=Flavobacterium sp. TaxID=239 RepID=UPI00375237DF